MILVQEADELCYRIGFACQKQAYTIETAKGVYDLKDKYTKTKIVDNYRLKGKELDVHYKLEGYPLVDKKSLVVSTINKRIDKLWSLEHPAWGSKITELRLWLSPSSKSNFRYGIVNIMGSKGLGYKEGRSPIKPYWLSFIRETLIKHYGAKEIEGFEADDALGMDANSSTVISHFDKDMDMIEGWHYNHVDDIIYYIEPGIGSISYDTGKKKIIGRGLLFFYAQLLTGDSIDNIPGCLNPEKAHHKKPPNISAAEGCVLLEGVQSEQVAFNIVKNMFEYTYKDRWLDAIEECADLLWICRRHNETGRQYLKNKGFI